jgi:hypothetical protein
LPPITGSSEKAYGDDSGCASYRTSSDAASLATLAIWSISLLLAILAIKRTANDGGTANTAEYVTLATAVISV